MFTKETSINWAKKKTIVSILFFLATSLAHADRIDNPTTAAILSIQSSDWGRREITSTGKQPHRS